MKFDEILANEELPSRKREFVESLKAFYETNNHLTPNQEKYWNSIYEDYCESAQLRKREWEETYDDEKREVARICAAYYIQTTGKWSARYFIELATDVLKIEGFIPTEKQYRAMCTNKYAKRILEETRSEPKYKAGEFVKFRSGKIPYRVLRSHGNPKAALVLETHAGPVTTAAKGAKLYKILLMGTQETFLVEERVLKTYRRKNGKN